MDRNYVSEFTVFMNQFLQDHPEVVKDQQFGWNIYWNPKGSRAEPNEAEEDRVPAESPGFGSMR